MVIPRIIWRQRVQMRRWRDLLTIRIQWIQFATNSIAGWLPAHIHKVPGGLKMQWHENLE